MFGLSYVYTKDLYLAIAPKLIFLQSVDFGADFMKSGKFHEIYQISGMKSTRFHEICQISWNLPDFMPEIFKSDNST